MFREALSKEFSEAGWIVDVAVDTDPGGYTIGAFRTPMQNEMWATAEFTRENFDNRDQYLEVSGGVGVSYQPAYRLWPLLVESERSELSENLGQFVDPPENVILQKLLSPEDALRIARAFVQIVLTGGLAWAHQFANIDSVLEEYRANPTRFSWEVEVIPVALAAAGRHIEARDSLEHYMRSNRIEVQTPEYKRFSFRLTRWLNSGGELPSPPRGIVGTRAPETGAVPSPEEIRRMLQGRREAVDRVRRQRYGKNRDELREMLNVELTRQGVNRSPLFIENTLDRMQASWFRRSVFFVRGVKTLAEAANGIRNVFRHGLPSQPEWLRPPQAAAHQIRANYQDWIRVELDSAAGDWLDRVMHSSAAAMLEMVAVEAWLSSDPERSQFNPRVVVHIGEPRVGAIEGEGAVPYEAEISAAARDQEYPVIPARLHRLREAPGYLLELAQPLIE